MKRSNQQQQQVYHLLGLLLVAAATSVMTRTTSSSSNRNCAVSKVEIPRPPIQSRIIYRYSCHSFSGLNPSIPITNMSSLPNEFNEISLAPNYYDTVPLSQLCLFSNVYMLNMSSNVLTSLQNVFNDLKCLNYLNTIDFSNNQIKTPIETEDFDETLASKLIYLNLNYNKIPSINSAVFFRSDGSSRFPKLIYLGLSFNQLISFDLLWPLSLPSPTLQVDAKNNPIVSLVNPLNKVFSDNNLAFSMTGGTRFVDLTTNNLQTFTDTNLLQYGLNSSYSFQQFLFKISNYDLRQSNLVPAIFCYCPPGGLFTNTWYSSFSSAAAAVSTPPPIYKLYCSNIPNNVYVFGFNCPTNSSATPPPLTTVAVATTSTEIAAPPNLKVGISIQSSANGNNNSSSSSSTSSSSSFNTNYLYFLLFLIPIGILITLCSMCCCCGRCCQLCTYNCCSCAVCSCLRPENSPGSIINGKVYDATICYSESDENWVDEDFMPLMARFSRAYKLHKLCLNLRSNRPLNKENEHILKSSKRIMLLFTKRFLEQEWPNRYLRDLIRSICIEDDYCVIVAVNFNVPEHRMNAIVYDLQVENKYDDMKAAAVDEDFTLNRKAKLGCFQRFRSRINYSLHLRDIEVLNFTDEQFWNKMNYVMPHAKKDDTKPTMITDSFEDRNQNMFKLPKLPMKTTVAAAAAAAVALRSQSMESSEGGSHSSSSLDLRISSKHMMKKKFKRLKPNIRVDSDSQNNSDVPLNMKKQTTTMTTKNSGRKQISSCTSSSSSLTTNKQPQHQQQKSSSTLAKNVSSIRHIIVTIPDYMRTQLGFNKKKATAQKLDSSRSQNSFTNSQLAIISENPHTHINLYDHHNRLHDFSQQQQPPIKLQQQQSLRHNIEQSPFKNLNESSASTNGSTAAAISVAAGQNSRVTLGGGSTNTTNVTTSHNPSQSSLKIPNYTYAYNFEVPHFNSEDRPFDSKYALSKNYVLTTDDLANIMDRERSDTPDILASFAPPMRPISSTPMLGAQRTRSMQDQDQHPQINQINQHQQHHHQYQHLHNLSSPPPQVPRAYKPGTKSGRMTCVDDNGNGNSSSRRYNNYN